MSDVCSFSTWAAGYLVNGYQHEMASFHLYFQWLVAISDTLKNVLHFNYKKKDSLNFQWLDAISDPSKIYFILISKKGHG